MVSGAISCSPISSAEIVINGISICASVSPSSARRLWYLSLVAMSAKVIRPSLDTITAAPVVVELARAASRHFSINGRKMYSELGGNFYEACICCIKSLNTLSILKC